MVPLWSAAAPLASPVLRLMLAARVRRGKEIAARLPERQGIETAARPEGRLLWLHAASVGETVSILPVLAALHHQAPDLTVLLTTGTVTSARLLAGRLKLLGLTGDGAACGASSGAVLHRFAPLDVPAWAGRFLDHWRPDAAGFVESELWPNQLAACTARGIPLMLVNARLSSRSAARWRRAPGLARSVLGRFDRVQAQSEADGARLAALGARAVTAPGDLKFAAPALPVDPDELARLRAMLAGRPLWVAASTHPGEEAAVFAVHRRLAAAHPGLLSILVPRHPERGAALAAEAAGLAVSRRGLGEPPPAAGVWIADTLGELGLFYRLAGIAFIGRSLLAPGGGQNPLEPARLACAIAVGPHTGNFTEAVRALRAADALAVVADADALADWVDAMLREPLRRAAAGLAAARSCDRHAELPVRTAEALLALVEAGRQRQRA